MFGAKNLKVPKNQLFSDKFKILRALYFLELLKIHNIGFSNGSKYLFLKVLCYFCILAIFPYVRLHCKICNLHLVKSLLVRGKIS